MEGSYWIGCVRKLRIPSVPTGLRCLDEERSMEGSLRRGLPSFPRIRCYWNACFFCSIIRNLPTFFSAWCCEWERRVVASYWLDITFANYKKVIRAPFLSFIKINNNGPSIACSFFSPLNINRMSSNNRWWGLSESAWFLSLIIPNRDDLVFGIQIKLRSATFELRCSWPSTTARASCQTRSPAGRLDMVRLHHLLDWL